MVLEAALGGMKLHGLLVVTGIILSHSIYTSGNPQDSQRAIARGSNVYGAGVGFVEETSVEINQRNSPIQPAGRVVPQTPGSRPAVRVPTPVTAPSLVAGPRPVPGFGHSVQPNLANSPPASQPSPVGLEQIDLQVLDFTTGGGRPPTGQNEPDIGAIAQRRPAPPQIIGSGGPAPLGQRPLTVDITLNNLPPQASPGGDVLGVGVVDRNPEIVLGFERNSAQSGGEEDGVPLPSPEGRGPLTPQARSEVARGGSTYGAGNSIEVPTVPTVSGDLNIQPEQPKTKFGVLSQPALAEDEEVPAAPPAPLAAPEPPQSIVNIEIGAQERISNQPPITAAPAISPAPVTPGNPRNGDGHHMGGIEWLPESIPGQPLIDYPVLRSLPDSGFDCKNQEYDGFFADTSEEARCQVFWVCHNGQQDGFLCPNGTIFHQRYFTCDWWFNVQCAESPDFYQLNRNIGVVGTHIDTQPAGVVAAASKVHPVFTLLSEMLRYPRVPPIPPQNKTRPSVSPPPLTTQSRVEIMKGTTLAPSLDSNNLGPTQTKYARSIKRWSSGKQTTLKETSRRRAVNAVDKRARKKLAARRKLRRLRKHVKSSNAFRRSILSETNPPLPQDLQQSLQMSSSAANPTPVQNNPPPGNSGTIIKTIDTFSLPALNNGGVYRLQDNVRVVQDGNQTLSTGNHNIPINYASQSPGTTPSSPSASPVSSFAVAPPVLAQRQLSMSVGTTQPVQIQAQGQSPPVQVVGQPALASQGQLSQVPNAVPTSPLPPGQSPSAQAQEQLLMPQPQGQPQQEQQPHIPPNGESPADRTEDRTAISDPRLNSTPASIPEKPSGPSEPQQPLIPSMPQLSSPSLPGATPMVLPVQPKNQLPPVQSDPQSLSPGTSQQQTGSGPVVEKNSTVQITLDVSYSATSDQNPPQGNLANPDTGSQGRTPPSDQPQVRGDNTMSRPSSLNLTAVTDNNANVGSPRTTPTVSLSPSQHGAQGSDLNNVASSGNGVSISEYAMVSSGNSPPVEGVLHYPPAPGDASTNSQPQTNQNAVPLIGPSGQGPPVIDEELEIDRGHSDPPIVESAQVYPDRQDQNTQMQPPSNISPEGSSNNPAGHGNSNNRPDGTTIPISSELTPGISGPDHQHADIVRDQSGVQHGMPSEDPLPANAPESIANDIPTVSRRSMLPNKQERTPPSDQPQVRGDNTMSQPSSLNLTAVAGNNANVGSPGTTPTVALSPSQHGAQGSDLNNVASPGNGVSISEYAIVSSGNSPPVEGVLHYPPAPGDASTNSQPQTNQNAVPLIGPSGQGPPVIDEELEIDKGHSDPPIVESAQVYPDRQDQNTQMQPPSNISSEGSSNNPAGHGNSNNRPDGATIPISSELTPVISGPDHQHADIVRDQSGVQHGMPSEDSMSTNAPERKANDIPAVPSRSMLPTGGIQITSESFSKITKNTSRKRKAIHDPAGLELVHPYDYLENGKTVATRQKAQSGKVRSLSKFKGSAVKQQHMARKNNPQEEEAIFTDQIGTVDNLNTRSYQSSKEDLHVEEDVNISGPGDAANITNNDSPGAQNGSIKMTVNDGSITPEPTSGKLKKQNFGANSDDFNFTLEKPSWSAPPGALGIKLNVIVSQAPGNESVQNEVFAREYNGAKTAKARRQTKSTGHADILSSHYPVRAAKYDSYDYEYSELPSWMRSAAKRSIPSLPSGPVPLPGGVSRAALMPVSAARRHVAPRAARKTQLTPSHHSKDFKRMLAVSRVQKMFQSARENLISILGGPKDVLDGNIGRMLDVTSSDKDKRANEMKLRFDPNSLTSYSDQDSSWF